MTHSTFGRRSLSLPFALDSLLKVYDPQLANLQMKPRLELVKSLSLLRDYQPWFGGVLHLLLNPASTPKAG